MPIIEKQTNRNDRITAAFNILFLLITLVFMFGYLKGNRYAILDDSYITYRYAQNLLDGNGLVFNPGERFYGSTAMGYALLLSLTTGTIHLAQNVLGFDRLIPLPVIATAISTASLALIWLVWYRLLTAEKFSLLRWLGGFLIAALFYTHWYSNRAPGHETYTYFALLVLSAYLFFYLKRYKLAGVSLAFSVMLRPDALLFAVLVYSLAALDHFIFQRQSWRDLGDKRTSLLIFSGLVLIWEVFLKLYFNSWIPETMVAKKAQVVLGVFPIFTIENVLAAIQSRSFMLFYPVLGMAIAAVIIYFFQQFLPNYAQIEDEKRNAVLMAILWLAHGIGLILAYEYFDVSQWPWYEVPIFYSFILLLAFGFWLFYDLAGKAYPNSRAKYYLVAGIVSVAALLYARHAVVFSIDKITAPTVFLHTYGYDPVIEYLHQVEPGGTTIATPEPGALGYKLGENYHVVDYLGLISPGVAEAIIADDGDYYFNRWRPEYILVVYTEKYAPLGRDWFEENYQLVQEFNHSWWDAKFGRGIYLYQLVEGS